MCKKCHITALWFSEAADVSLFGKKKEMTALSLQIKHNFDKYPITVPTSGVTLLFFFVIFAVVDLHVAFVYICVHDLYLFVTHFCHFVLN